jgi:lipoyl(octanoyl) transferase
MNTARVKNLGSQSYRESWQAMQAFTDSRQNNTPDEIWIVEHPPVFTLGQAGKREHILNSHDIPVVESDRGGQVTYHGPGQLVIYLLIDIRRLGIGPRQLVNTIEESIIEALKDLGIEAFSKKDAPGVYVSKEQLAKNKSIASNDAKIAALGLRIRKGCSYHGLSLNIDMDLTPFSYINPCGYEGQAVCQVKDFSTQKNIKAISQELCETLQLKLAQTNK